jgi:putative ABC transport system permease protein
MILARVSMRNLLRHPWQSILSIVGIALGVAVVIAIDLTNESARRAFKLSQQMVAGQATHHIVGGPTGLDETLYRDLRVGHGIRGMWPVVEGWVRLPDHNDQRFRVIGVDPFAQSTRSAIYRSTRHLGPTELLSGRNTALLADDTARRLPLTVPGKLPVRGAGGHHLLRVTDTVQSDNALEGQALRTVVITDIATAQVVTGNVGRISRIDLELNDVAAVARVRGLLPPDAELTSSASRGNALQQMTRAFEVNLTALSLLALVVGMFLIYNTMTVSVLQRHAQIATLRTLGVSNHELFASVTFEALTLGVLGVLAGIGLGIVLSHQLLGLVAQTINDLYFRLDVKQVSISGFSLAKGIALGIGATVVAALAPALEASRVPPQITYTRSGQETAARRSVGRLAWFAIVPCVVAAALLLLPGRSLYAGFAGLFFAIFGFALLAPALLLLIVRITHPWLSRALGLIGRMAGRGVTESLSRTRVTVAALAIAVSATVGVGIMITSFRTTVEHWLVNYLRADLYVSASGSTTGVDPGLIRRVSALPGVRSVTTARWTKLEGSRGRTQLFVLDAESEAFENFQFKYGDAASAWPRFKAGDAVIVSEPYAYHHRRGVGDKVVLRTDRGAREFVIAGVFYDYGSDRGVVALHRDTYRRHWTDPAISSFAVYLDAAVDVESFAETLQRGVLKNTELTLRSNRQLRALSMEIFDRTFAITNVLRVLTVVIAVIGIFSALMSIQLERGREFAVLRANGFTPRQLWALVTTETGLLGLAAGVLALPLGLFLALALIYIINRRSFGWTMQVWVTPDHFVLGLTLAVTAGLLAGLYPALRLARTPPSFALRHE